MMNNGKLMAITFLTTLALALAPASPAMALPEASSTAGGDAIVAIEGMASGKYPNPVRHYYGFDQVSLDGTGQTIAIISAYNYKNAAVDMEDFGNYFGLKQMYGLPGTESCTIADGPHPCFQVVKSPSANQDAVLKITENTSFHQESALDTQWARAVAQGANILLVEAPTGQIEDLLVAVDKAVEMGASVVSMSWGVPESEVADLEAANQHFQVPGVTFVAATGDHGTEVLFPSSSPNVLAVGGTKAVLTYKGTSSGETAWSTSVSGSVGGESTHFSRPAYQEGFQSAEMRTVPDVSYAASDGYATVYNGKWMSFGGTSAGAPQWAGLIALSNQARAESGKTPLSGVESVYRAASGAAKWDANFLDITSGTGACGTDACAAVSGYDLATGLGSPKVGALVWTLAGLSRTGGAVMEMCGNWDCAVELENEAIGLTKASAYYRFEASADQEYRISYAPSYTSAVEIYDAEQNLLATLHTSGFAAVMESWTAPSDGTYYLAVQSAGRSIFYSLRIDR